MLFVFLTGCGHVPCNIYIYIFKTCFPPLKTLQQHSQQTCDRSWSQVWFCVLSNFVVISLLLSCYLLCWGGLNGVNNPWLVWEVFSAFCFRAPSYVKECAVQLQLSLLMLLIFSFLKYELRGMSRCIYMRNKPAGKKEQICSLVMVQDL